MDSPFQAPALDKAGSLQGRVPLWKSVAVLLIGGATIIACLNTYPPTMGGTPGVIMQLPYRVKNYWGYDQAVSYTEKTILPPDTEFVRKVYESPEGDSILCSIVMSGVEKRSIHRPENCLPGQGWTIDNNEVIEVPLLSGKKMKVMSLSLSRPVERNNRKEVLHCCYLYWFVGQNVVTPYHSERIWLTTWDMIFHHINHRWAYVIVSSNVTQGFQRDGKDRDETIQMLKDFIRDIVPSFQKVEPRD